MRKEGQKEGQGERAPTRRIRASTLWSAMPPVPRQNRRFYVLQAASAGRSGGAFDRCRCRPVWPTSRTNTRESEFRRATVGELVAVSCRRAGGIDDPGPRRPQRWCRPGSGVGPGRVFEVGPVRLAPLKLARVGLAPLLALLWELSVLTRDTGRLAAAPGPACSWRRSARGRRCQPSLADPPGCGPVPGPAGWRLSRRIGEAYRLGSPGLFPARSRNRPGGPAV